MKKARRCIPLVGLVLLICFPGILAAQQTAGGKTTDLTDGASKKDDYRHYPMWNTSLPIEQRVNDLVSRLTLEEKVGQMLNAAPAIVRLGIPAYDWWNETLHGVARTPYHVTSYPQAIGMAATWDTAALYQMADYSATEGRAVHNKATSTGRNNERYMGLTYWTPNINIFRDPRWGRGQETYGEDPYLTAKLGAAFVRGLQGDDPKYLKAAACAKHFAVHSGPEPSRHADNFTPSAHDLWDTYLPAFHELIVNARVAGVMCAYNALNSQPCCANDLLMNDILRHQWKFDGYVTSDCWAIDDFFKYHKTHKDATSAAVDAIIHGTDVECGTSVYYSLVDAVKKGLLTEQQLDVSVKRLFTIRYRLGMFDPASQVKYAQTPESVLESPEHVAHALKMARESIVLLQNRDQLLPLSRTIRKIAVIGPNADNKIAVLGNYNGTPSHVVTLLEGIKKKLGPDAEVIYEKAVNYTNDTLLAYRDIAPLLSFNGEQGVQAQYYNNEKLSGEPVKSLIEKDIDHYWAEGQTPVPGLGTIHYSARYTTLLSAPKSETMNFEIEGDDGYRLYINDKMIVDAWQRNRWGARQFLLPVKKDSTYKIVIEFYQNEGNAGIRLKAGDRVKTDFTALAEKLKGVDAIIFAGGISPQLEGEEMPVQVPGFNGGDRTSIMLPQVQTELLQALQRGGKPVVFVMMTGSAIACPWENENIPAILNAWYGGQEAGTAIADVLFGDYNPSGRLPVTFYQSDKDLPAFGDYSMQGRTYRYFNGKALYPFGYGLSYSRFNYSQLNIPENTAQGTPLAVKAIVTNTGDRDGDEVVQLYVSHPGIAGAPVKALKGFRRVHLQRGETKALSFRLTPEELSLINEKGIAYQPKGKITISIGGRQPGTDHQSTSNVVSKTILIH
ncbi:glycoside hydrolase family 3 C-terminal domain-containing protein [Chitinophaga filiformis]|uniref:Glycoside hydrolase family 3 C-terminal domain-containing protein n=1 Tax=Chitinophaga filiformis TaxID=104663 RepID=A0ABY4I833_CHIFI|nr:glycoside hydrolase family 3 C-terminal domain-containing protein [Chitinophaga filiformis]UPK72247.1 glycoside hydrolase family 3 C-terminal domain-containing protein [Chitinophaga filiformis]